jgi:hypothetical protein
MYLDGPVRARIIFRERFVLDDSNLLSQDAKTGCIGPQSRYFLRHAAGMFYPHDLHWQ